MQISGLWLGAGVILFLCRMHAAAVYNSVETGALMRFVIDYYASQGVPKCLCHGPTTTVSFMIARIFKGAQAISL